MSLHTPFARREILDRGPHAEGEPSAGCKTQNAMSERKTRLDRNISHQSQTVRGLSWMPWSSSGEGSFYHRRRKDR